MDESQIENVAIDAGSENIESWAFIEIYGHKKVAGRMTSRKIGTEIMFQVDVPKGETELSHSELYGPKAIFSITPTTEAWCRKWAKAALKYNHQPLPYIPEDRQLVESTQQEEDYVND